MTQLFEQALQFRAKLLSGNSQAIKQMTNAYMGVFNSLNAQLETLIRQIEDRERLGLEVSESWLRRQDNYQRLIFQTAQEVQRFADQIATPLLSREQQRAIADALRESVSLITKAVSDFNIVVSHLPTKAVESLVGFTANGTKLFSGYGRVTARLLKDKLIETLATGKSPRTASREVAKILQRPTWEAARLVRTTTLNAYRQATSETYKENSDILSGWMWLSAKTVRTCATCWAMDGQEFPLSEPLSEHWNGRCTSVPIVKGFSARTRQTGEEKFMSLSEDEQREILGIAKFDAYQNGEITLRDLVGTRKDEVWGKMRFERSFKDALALKRKRAA